MGSIENVKRTFDYMFNEIGKVIVGQDDALRQIMISIFCNGNALLESYPGLAKTLSIKTMAQIMDLKFSRIQHTPDLMPSDITGTYIIEESGGKRIFKFQEGPVFANIVLADEINRATPKTQSALLEAMEEKQVTVGNRTFELDKPFFVLATQNPIEQEGSLAMDQQVFVNGQLKTGKELLASVKDSCLIEDEKGIKLYDLNAWTLALNTAGKLEKQPCFLYTLPYHDEMISVRTKTGKKIKVTKNHSFLVNDHGIIAWKKAEELTKEDYLVQPARISVQPIRVPSHEETLARMTQKPIAEIPLDKDFAFWIAFLLSDGAIGEKYVEACQKNYPEALDRFVEISERYGFHPSLRSDSTGCRYAKIYSKPLVEYLQIRFGIKTGKEKCIPSWFLSFPEELNKEFLKTFISLESSLRDMRIVFTQKKEQDVNTIAYMLLRENILSWIRYDGRIFRLKIQGKDFATFLKKISWIDTAKLQSIDLERTAKSSFRVVPVERKNILRLVELLGINSFHTLKERTSLTERPWYGSYKGIKEGEIVMSVDSLRQFADDISNELHIRKSAVFQDYATNEPRRFAAGIGVPITQVTEQLSVSKHKAWQHYSGEHLCTEVAQFLEQQYDVHIQEAEQLLQYCQALLSEDVYYDKIASLEYSNRDDMAFGLTVPELQNYIAGFGACGINHNTYPLPEAQADRFLLKIKMDYPKFEEEVEIVERYAEVLKNIKLKPIITKNSILQLQQLTRQIPIANDLKKYVVQIVTATRTKKNLIEYGASPRASIGLVLSAKARALLEGRKYVSKEDIHAMALPILRHRIILNFEAERNNMDEDDVIKQILK